VLTVSRIGLVACSKTKKDVPWDELVPAAELYTGDLFRKSYAWAKRECDRVLILSSLWHVLEPDALIRTYEHYLPTAGPEWRKIWPQHVLALLEDLVEDGDTIVCLASAPYRGWVPASPWPVEIPLEGLQLGEQLAWLKRQNAGV
jgi:cytoplasmic iron level regulating protein YaaA (DUF328/UPF0246 family)